MGMRYYDARPSEFSTNEDDVEYDWENRPVEQVDVVEGRPCGMRIQNGGVKLWFFNCLEAECTKPSDRAMLLGRIRAEWHVTGEEGVEAAKSGEEAFNEFVRTELKDYVAESKRRYQGQLREVLARSFNLVFGD